MENDSALLDAQQRIHEMIAQQHRLEDTLNAIADWTARMLPGARVSIMRYDPVTRTLNLVPGPLFSPSYIDQLQRLPVAPEMGTCGAAAHDLELVITEAIQTDPRWADSREAAAEECLRACWSMPIETADHRLLGTFATYYSAPARPTDEALRCLTRGASLATLALLRHQDNERHRRLFEWHEALFVHHPEGVYELDLESHFQRCNAALESITGFPEQTLIGQHFREFIDPEYRQLTEQAFASARAGRTITYETMGRHANQMPYYLEVTNFPVRVRGEIVGVYGICRDVSVRKQRLDELHLLKRGMEASPSGLLMADATQPGAPIVFVNPAFSEITGYSRAEVLGRNCRFLRGPDTAPEAVAEIRKGISEQRYVKVTLLNYRKDGSPFWNQLVISPVFGEAGACTHFIGIQQDVTREQEQEAELIFQSRHDALTGLLNQAAFNQELAQVFDRHQAEGHLLTLLYLDLDGFRSMNDGLGHGGGNQVLKAVAKRLQRTAGPEAVIARVAGDEFALMLPECPGRAPVIRLAQRILESLSEAMQVGDQSVHLSASMGIACNSMEGLRPHVLLRHASLAANLSKRQGRNTWQWYSGGLAERARHSVALRHDLHQALREDQFVLHFQPQFDVGGQSMQQVEALVRWQAPGKGLVAPGTFITVAEETGQIIPIGRWVLRQACLEIAQYNARSGQSLAVAVNLSPMQFHRDGFLEDVRMALRASGLAPHLLELEVTESVLLDGVEPVVRLMESLRKMGVRLALDDFGTGFSSLSYLRDLPIQKIKLDRSFIGRVLSDRSSAAIVHGVIAMAHHMDLRVVAEGVETAAQQRDLIRRGCDYIQGFLLARPMPLADLEAGYAARSG